MIMRFRVAFIIAAVVVLAGCIPPTRTAPGGQYPVHYDSFQWPPVAGSVGENYCSNVVHDQIPGTTVNETWPLCRELRGVRANGDSLPVWSINLTDVELVSPWLNAGQLPPEYGVTYADSATYGQMVMTKTDQIFEGCWLINSTTWACDFQAVHYWVQPRQASKGFLMWRAQHSDQIHCFQTITLGIIDGVFTDDMARDCEGQPT